MDALQILPTKLHLRRTDPYVMKVFRRIVDQLHAKSPSVFKTRAGLVYGIPRKHKMVQMVAIHGSISPKHIEALVPIYSSPLTPIPVIISRIFPISNPATSGTVSSSAGTAFKICQASPEPCDIRHRNRDEGSTRVPKPFSSPQIPGEIGHMMDC